MSKKYKFESFLEQYDLETLFNLKRGINAQFGSAIKNGVKLTEDFTGAFKIFNLYLKAIHDELFDVSDETGFPKAQKYFGRIYGKKEHQPQIRYINESVDKRIKEILSNMETPSIYELESNRLGWSIALFKKSTPFSSLNHAAEELKEIRQSLDEGKPDPLEYADAIMCLLDSAARAGVSLTEIMIAMNQKNEINKKRSWRENPDGSYSHVKDDPDYGIYKAFEGRM